MESYNVAREVAGDGAQSCNSAFGSPSCGGMRQRESMANAAIRSLAIQGGLDDFEAAHQYARQQGWLLKRERLSRRCSRQPDGGPQGANSFARTPRTVPRKLSSAGLVLAPASTVLCRNSDDCAPQRALVGDRRMPINVGVRRLSDRRRLSHRLLGLASSGRSPW